MDLGNAGSIIRCTRLMNNDRPGTCRRLHATSSAWVVRGCPWNDTEGAVLIQHWGYDSSLRSVVSTVSMCP